jgi:hypothetical protein
MKLGDYSVQIQGGLERDTGYVEITHNTKYKILLSNDSFVDCDAAVEIDGKEVGLWRIYSGKNICIERPVNDTGQFTFYKLDSSEAGKIGLAPNDKLGLITVLFKPAVLFNPDKLVFRHPMKKQFRSGGTGLSGKSEQKFVDVPRLNYDESAFVQIHLRLVCNDDEPRPLMPLSTSIPPSLCHGAVDEIYGSEWDYMNDSEYSTNELNNFQPRWGATVFDCRFCGAEGMQWTNAIKLSKKSR